MGYYTIWCCVWLTHFCFESKSESEVAQSCPTLCDPMDCSLPGPLVHGIFQARVLEWVINLNKHAFLVAWRVKHLPAMWDTQVQSLGSEDPWKRKWQPTSVFWPGEFHGLYSPWDRKEWDTNEQLHLINLLFSCSFVSDSLQAMDYSTPGFPWSPFKIISQVVY